MTKLQEVNGVFTIGVPKLMIRKKKWQKGQECIWSFNENGDLVLMSVD